MATPQQNAQTITSYWKSAAMTDAQYAALASGGRISGAFEQTAALARAQLAMKELVQQATSDPATRLSVFAKYSLFETALLVEDGRVTGILLDAARAGKIDMVSLAPLVQGDRKLRAPRQIMLDGIHAAGTAGVFSIKDPSGMTSWLHSVLAASAAINGAIQGDPDGGVRAALLTLLRDVALPEGLARALKTGRTFESLTELLPGSTLPVAARKTIQILAAEADGRITRDLAQLPSLGELPAFPTGDGATAPTLPPALAWYRRPSFWATGALGLLAGGLAASRATR